MQKINFKEAFYLKLGEGGRWEDELIKGNKARIGWSNIDIIDIQKEDWVKIRKDIEEDFLLRGKKNGATNDFNALKFVCDATDEDIFITFHKGRLFWWFLDNSKVQKDGESKYRTIKNKFNCCDINGKTLEMCNITGEITKLQAYPATLCKIAHKDTLIRIINAEKNAIIEEIEKKEADLNKCVLKALAELDFNAKDFEILTDVIFQQTGWLRISELGEQMKHIDLIYEEPITKKKYFVQVKASIDKSGYEKCAKELIGYDYSKLFFVVYKPHKDLDDYKNKFEGNNIELIKDEALAKLIIDLGLLNWLKQKCQ